MLNLALFKPILSILSLTLLFCQLPTPSYGNPSIRVSVPISIRAVKSTGSRESKHTVTETYMANWIFSRDKAGRSQLIYANKSINIIGIDSISDNNTPKIIFLKLEDILYLLGHYSAPIDTIPSDEGINQQSQWLSLNLWSYPKGFQVKTIYQPLGYLSLHIVTGH